ncbi:phospholipase D-like domain-containing protein [Campylobacter sp. 2018MI13]|uniref:phospholipase D-like domain-containing protein n=1 Tax=Campylobacter sp. 2018MI13 TaxID=2836737 RepID=UPI001BDA91CE|nr:phospholipase D-like domain-containing protein [Campylobacter sp. 2018MI13]MBT0882745.1 hypothetical protein [Campylobacter sp. 2018MI13]
MKIDLDLIQHKFAYFGEDKNYELYDIKYVFYPVYKCVANCIFKESEELTRIESEILKILKILKENHLANLKSITCLDKDVLNTILAELTFKGYLDEFLTLSNKAKDYLNDIKSKKITEKDLCLVFDGVLGDILEVSESDIRLENKIQKDTIEIMPKNKSRPRNECLNEIFKDDKTLKQNIFESLKSFGGVLDGEIYQINELNSIGKFYQKHLCCFYKNQESEEKIIALSMQSDELKADENISRMFDELIDQNNFNVRENQASKENSEKFQKYTSSINFEEGLMIDECSHGKYLKYSLNNAKKDIYIQSPWVRAVVLKEYLNDFKNALSKGVNIHIKYGIEKRNRHDKESIDNEGLTIFNELIQEYKNFKIYQDNSHEKILICDDDYIITGSFNWLSYKHNDGNERKESSMISKNKDSIIQKIKEFK